MELKETKRLPTSVEINKTSPSERNDPDRKAIYNILYPLEENLDEKHSDSNSPEKKRGKPALETVSTLEWLNTWRPLEISQDSSPDPGK